MKAQIWNKRIWLIKKEKNIDKVIEKVLLKCKFNILGKISYRFQPQGFTALWLLSESHCAIHTWPEENKLYIEISSCNKEKYINFLDHIKRI